MRTWYLSERQCALSFSSQYCSGINVLRRRLLLTSVRAGEEKGMELSSKVSSSMILLLAERKTWNDIFFCPAKGFYSLRKIKKSSSLSRHMFLFFLSGDWKAPRNKIKDKYVGQANAPVVFYRNSQGMKERERKLDTASSCCWDGGFWSECSLRHWARGYCPLLRTATQSKATFGWTCLCSKKKSEN